jgi:hypothetical protein
LAYLTSHPEIRKAVYIESKNVLLVNPLNVDVCSSLKNNIVNVEVSDELFRDSLKENEITRYNPIKTSHSQKTLYMVLKGCKFAFTDFVSPNNTNIQFKDLKTTSDVQFYNADNENYPGL